MPNLSTKNESLLHRWVTGELTRREEAELEALAREDDFLAEALAGLRGNPELDLATLVDRLRKRLDRRKTRKKSFVWQSLAAAILLLFVAGAGFWLLDSPLAPARTELAEARPEPATEALPAAPETDPAESASAPTTDPPVIAERETPPPAPRRAVAKAATPTEQAAPEPVPVSPPVSRNVPAAVLPEAYADAPPPPPNPATAGLTSRGAPTAAPTAVPAPPRAAAPTEYSAAPVPYSIGAQSIAADTPNRIPAEKTEEDTNNYVEGALGEEVAQSIARKKGAAKANVAPNDRPTMVAPPGGHEALRRQLREEKAAGLPAGRVRLEFTVTKGGELRRFQVLETPDPRLSQWLMERLRQTGDWKFLHGEGPYTVRYSIKFD